MEEGRVLCIDFVLMWICLVLLLDLWFWIVVLFGVEVLKGGCVCDYYNVCVFGICFVVVLFGEVLKCDL